MIKSTTIPYDGTRSELLKDAEVAAGYLEECLVDGNLDLFKQALKHVADARLGGMTALSKETGLGRETLYQTLSEKGNPTLATLEKVLHATGLRIAITPEAEPTH